MTKVSPIKNRKDDHLRVNLEEDVRSAITTDLERINLEHQALPEFSLSAVETQITLLKRQLDFPLILSSMTGGTSRTGRINRHLAEAAQAARIGMGLGSMRVALDHTETLETFKVRKYAPDILLFANLGAIQLNYGYGIEQCQYIVDACEADALILHLNALQEALQPEGDTDFSGLLAKIEQICHRLSVPVVCKEVGWGISSSTARKLANCGVAAIDVAGAGGTSWSQVEMHRNFDAGSAAVAAAFHGWGIPTAQSLSSIRKSLPRMTLIASGGLRDGVDIAKCIALGANAAGMAGAFLEPAIQGADAVLQKLHTIERELRIAMFSCGAIDLKALSHIPLHPVQPSIKQ